jgi:excinuclease UvrABC nuclease subunit
MRGWVVKMEDYAVLEGFVEVTPILRAGVYALVRDGRVVYVGKGKRMLPRVEAHRGNWGRKSVPAWMPVSMRGVLFDQVFVMPCRVEDLDRIERAMIDLYKPRYNIALKAPTPTTTALEITIPSGITIPFNQPRSPPRFERRI